MRLCKDCKHLFSWKGYGGDIVYCGAMIGKTDPVSGNTLRQENLIYAFDMRKTLCGWDEPKLFEPKTT